MSDRLSALFVVLDLHSFLALILFLYFVRFEGLAGYKPEDMLACVPT
jgi:hypothetical protein